MGLFNLFRKKRDKKLFDNSEKGRCQMEDECHNQKHAENMWESGIIFEFGHRAMNCHYSTLSVSVKDGNCYCCWAVQTTHMDGAGGNVKIPTDLICNNKIKLSELIKLINCKVGCLFPLCCEYIEKEVTLFGSNPRIAYNKNNINQLEQVANFKSFYVDGINILDVKSGFYYEVYDRCDRPRYAPIPAYLVTNGVVSCTKLISYIMQREDDITLPKKTYYSFDLKKWKLEAEIPLVSEQEPVNTVFSLISEMKYLAPCAAAEASEELKILVSDKCYLLDYRVVASGGYDNSVTVPFGFFANSTNEEIAEMFNKVSYQERGFGITDCKKLTAQDVANNKEIQRLISFDKKVNSVEYYSVEQIRNDSFHTFQSKCKQIDKTQIEYQFSYVLSTSLEEREIINVFKERGGKHYYMQREVTETRPVVSSHSGMVEERTKDIIGFSSVSLEIVKEMAAKGYNKIA